MRKLCPSSNSITLKQYREEINREAVKWMKAFSMKKITRKCKTRDKCKEKKKRAWLSGIKKSQNRKKIKMNMTLMVRRCLLLKWKRRFLKCNFYRWRIDWRNLRMKSERLNNLFQKTKIEWGSWISWDKLNSLKEMQRIDGESTKWMNWWGSISRIRLSEWNWKREYERNERKIIGTDLQSKEKWIEVLEQVWVFETK